MRFFFRVNSLETRRNAFRRNVWCLESLARQLLHDIGLLADRNWLSMWPADRRQLSRSCPGLCANIRVLEPENVRDQRRVAQQQELRYSPWRKRNWNRPKVHRYYCISNALHFWWLTTRLLRERTASGPHALSWTTLSPARSQLAHRRILGYWSGTADTLCCKLPIWLWQCILSLLLSGKISRLSYNCNLTWRRKEKECNINKQVDKQIRWYIIRWYIKIYDACVYLKYIKSVA